MRKPFLLIIFALFFGTLQSQNTYKVKGCLDNIKYQKVYLATILGTKTKIVDSSQVTNGCFDFNLPLAAPPGMYSIILDARKNAYIRILFNNENIVFHSDLGHLLDSMNFTESRENKLYYDYSRFISVCNRKVEMLTKISNLYTTGDKFFKNCQEEITIVNQQMVDEPVKIIRNSPGTFVAQLLNAQQPVYIPESINEKGRKRYLQDHYLDNIDFTYAPLVRTDILPIAVKNYMALFEQKGFSQAEQEVSYTEGIDKLLAKCAVNQEVMDFVIKELLEIFSFGNYDIMNAYITEKYMLSNKCESDADARNYKMTIDNIRRVSVGKSAPEIVMTDNSGNETRLSSFTNDYTLVVFWSTTCPHCTKMLPELKDIYSRCDTNSLKIISFSLDPDRKKWTDFLAKDNYKWINYNDPSGWQGKTCQAYNIRATPLFFLLNKEKIIVAKPLDLVELKEKLRSFKILK